MSNEAVRCIYIPVQGEPEELVLPVEDGKFFAEEKLGGTPRIYVLPDRVVFITKSEDTLTGPRNVRLAGFSTRGPIIIGCLDSMHDPVSLTDEQTAFYKLAVQQHSDATPLDLGSDREIMIADIVVTYRSVKMSPQCACTADLTRNDALVLWDYADEGWNARLPRFARDREGSLPQLGVLVSASAPPPQPGEAMIKNIAVTCRACSRVLVEGEIRNEEPAE